MTISRVVQPLDSQFVRHENNITERWLKESMGNLNSLYESLFDTKAPLASIQGWSGHDHLQSGGPITRGCAWSEDGGSVPLYTYSPTASKQFGIIDTFGITKQGGGTARFYGSPLFDPLRSKLGGWLCYSASSSEFRVSFLEVGVTFTNNPESTNFLDLKADESGDTAQIRWVELPDVPLSPGVWNRLEMYAENNTYDSENPPELKIYGIYTTEAQHVTQTKKSRTTKLAPQSNAATVSGRAFAGFEPLNTTLADSYLWFDSDLLSRLYWTCNALYEATLDQSAPNKQSQTVKGHDHDNDGGLNVTRNKVASLSGDSGDKFRVQIAASGEHGSSAPSTGSAIWHLFDRDTTAGGLRSTAGIPHLIGPVSPGITNTGSSTTPYLDSYFHLWAVGSVPGFNVSVCVYNRDQAAFSVVSTLNSGATSAVKGWLYVDEIPCVADAFNEFDLYVQCSVPSVTIYLTYCQVSESGILKHILVSQPESSGSTTHLGVYS